MKKIIHHYPKCIGCGACVGLAGQIFEFDATTGKSKLIDGEPTQINNEEVTIRTVDDEVLDDGTAELLVGSCCMSIIEIQKETVEK